MVAALLFLALQLESVSDREWLWIAAGGAIASLAVTAALQAVDGIALKAMVDAWAVAPARKRISLFTRFRDPSTGDWLSECGESFVRASR
jgi:hypothetical protein